MNKNFRRDRYYIALFDTKNYAIQMYYTLEKQGYRNYQLISTPCQITGGCNYSIKFNDIEDFRVLKEQSEIYNRPIREVYLFTRENGKNYIKRIGDMDNLFE
ncbi:DUF3343 domain-containing protein [Clostridiisalibacter paucivorans]|uniref:DUF3343 domain-containing protein n=1 Tax=Clostridiisalibacter paucivorans TaxID=408753 RepID=UPI00047B9A82|nr:DUF3343 domain-containing protein [Clostridiisalibacter paucivorans]